MARLPEGPLHWRIESFPSARGGAGRGGAAGAGGRAWRPGLAVHARPAGGATRAARGSRGSAVAVFRPPATAARNRAGGPPGAMTPVHSHPGSEAFYVLAGQLSQRTPHGIVRLEAGQAMNGHGAGMAMQLTSSGRRARPAGAVRGGRGPGVFVAAVRKARKGTVGGWRGRKGKERGQSLLSSAGWNGDSHFGAPPRELSRRRA